MKDNTERSPSLPDESAYPPQLTADYELLECFSASHDLETLLARRIIAADVEPGSALKVDLDENGEFTIRN